MKKLPVSVQSFSHDSWKKLLEFYEATVEASPEMPTLSEVIEVLVEDADEAPSV